VIVIAGSAVDARAGFLDPGYDGNAGANLVWSHDASNGLVVQLTYSVDAIDINIVNVYENRLVYNEGINP
jgi:hypothetical protein